MELRRHLRACAYALLLTGIALGLTGLIGDNGDLVTAGSILAFSGVPGSLVASIDRAYRVSDDQLAAAHRAGYELALDHVARGLLDPRTPPHGHQNDPETGHDAPNVRRLHAIPQTDRHAV